MSTITEERFVVPADLLSVQLRDASPETRRRIGGSVDDVAVNRPGSRALTRVLDAGMAMLLQEFRTPSRIVDAVLRFSHAQGLDPLVTLEESFDALSSLINANFLLREGGAGNQPAIASHRPGDMVGGLEITRVVQVLEDTELYAARDAAGNAVALKLGRKASAHLTRYMIGHERDMLLRLSGAPCPSVIAAGEDNGSPYLAMSWCDGVPATGRAMELRRAGGPERDSRLRELCVSVLDAWAEIHARGVLHGDVHPGNVLVEEDGAVSVIDFGRAVIIGDLADDILAMRAGVPLYYEPELARAMLDGVIPPLPTAAGEQYALAALLYLLITGNYYLDFSPEHPVLCRQILEGTPRPFVSRGREPWPDMECVLRRALSRDPESRYPDVAAFRDAVAACDVPATGAWPVAPVDAADGKVIDALLDRLALDGELFERGLTRPPTGSVSFGEAGIAWFLYRMSLLRDDPALLVSADAWAARVDTVDADGSAFVSPRHGLTPDVVGTVSPLHTASGVHCVRAVIARARGDRGAFASDVRAFLASVGEPEQRLDLSFGSAGVLSAAAVLLDGAVDEGIEARQALLAFTTRLVADVLDRVSSLPGIGSQAERVVGQYGMAHGWAGILHALLRATGAAGIPVLDPVIDRLDELAACATHVGDAAIWPITPQAGSGPSHADPGAGWCRGSAGYVHLWTLADSMLPEGGYRDLALRAAMHAWTYEGLQASLCCGLAGRALALARVFQMTGDDLWRQRAEQVAVKALRGGITLPDRELSLFHGSVGIALARAELDDPLYATMPLFGPEGW